MKIGIGSYTYPWAVSSNLYPVDRPLGAMELLKKAIKLGVDCVQFADNMPLHQISFEERNEIATIANEAGIGLEVGTRGLTLQHMEQYIGISTQFKSPFVRVVIDDIDYAPNSDQIVDIIWKLLPLLKKNDIILAIENHDRLTSSALVDIIERTDKNFVGICLDTANSIGAGEGINEVLKKLGMYTVNLHIKDITIERLPHKMGFKILGCAAGDGNIDIPMVLDNLKNNSRMFSVTLEIWSDFFENVQSTIHREELWAQKSLSYLKQIIN